MYVGCSSCFCSCVTSHHHTLYLLLQEMMPLFEAAAKDAAFAATQPHSEGEEEVQPIQVTLTSSSNPILIRELGASQVRVLHALTTLRRHTLTRAYTRRHHLNQRHYRHHQHRNHHNHHQSSSLSSSTSSSLPQRACDVRCSERPDPLAPRPRH
jgi:hypothetical protein